MRLGRIDLVRLVEEAQDLAEFEEAMAAAVRALPADPSSLIEFLEVPTADAFDVPPQQAINYFKSKGLRPTFSYADLMESAHDSAFTVAKMMDVDMLGQIRASLDSAMANGTPFQEWADSITPVLQSGGWWGRKAVKDPLTGQEIVAQLGSPWRLETIFRTNMQTAYAAGAWQEIVANKATAPYLMYDAIDDDRTRPLHASWDQTILPVTSDWWGTHFPPNGYACRCGVIQLSADEVEGLGLTVSVDPPNNGSFDWTNPRNGEVLVIPKGIDPGFAHNAGQSWAWKQKQLLKEKVGVLPPDMQAAAKKAKQEAEKLSQDAIEAATAAQAELASAEAKKALAQAQAKAAEKAKRWAAKEQIDLIAKGSKDALGSGAQYKIKGLTEAKKIAGWEELRPVEQLDKVNEIAATLKAKAVQSQNLSNYKKAILEGKNPPPAAAAAFKTLPEDEATAWLAKVEAEKAAIQAQKAAEAAAAAQKAAAGVPLPVKPSVAKFSTMAEDAEEALLAGNLEDLSIIKQAMTGADGFDAQAVQAYIDEAIAYVKSGAKPPPAAPVSQVVQAVGPQAPDPSTMVVIGRKTKGGTPGALYQDTATGQKWLIKFNGSEDAVRNEVLSARLYNLAGVEAPELHAITIEGKPALASRIIDGITEVDAKTLASTQSVLDGFAVDAWLANWDAAGLSFDNIVLVGGRAMRIDVGGSLRYRAIGGLKGNAFGDTVGEIDSLRDGTNAQARAVFGKMTADDIERSVEKVLAVREADIRALVSNLGPVDPIERDKLVGRLIARQRDLAKRYPAAAERVRARAGGQADQAASSRVTAQEQQFVEESRVNGYGFATDSDQIEDNMVVVHTFKRADGSDATRGFFKLLPGASKELRAAISLVSSEGAGVPLGSVREEILQAVKSINYRAQNGQALDAKVLARCKSAMLSINSTIAELNRAAAVARDPSALNAAAKLLGTWRNTLEAVALDAQAAKQATKLPMMFDTSAFPDVLAYVDKGAKAAADAGIKWKKVTGEYEFTTASFDRSFARETTGRARVAGAALRYEAELPDGTRVTYFPHDSSVAWAMQGVMKIDAPGRGVESTASIFRTIGDIGLKSTRATELDRKHLYLNAYARLRLVEGREALREQFDAIQDRGEAGLVEKLAILKRATGVDIEDSDGWRNVDGVRQAFGHGRAYQLRPDLSAADMQKLDRTHVLYHNPQGLSTDAGSGVFDRLKTVIDGGGVFASLTDRVRRGVPLSGSSVSSDLASGGGDYHFTRIRSRAAAKGTGVYWRTGALRRMDAITYESDMFGRTTGDTVFKSRKGQTIDEFKRVASGSSNETIFKGGLSIFDDIDRIVLASQAEVDAAIAWMKGRGYTSWPDGRALAEVIITKAKHAKD